MHLLNTILSAVKSDVGRLSFSFPPATPAPAVPFDYEPLNSRLTIDPDEQNLVQCVPLQINDDSFLEDLFEGLAVTLSLAAPDPRITITNGTLESVIQDNDRECAVY